MQRLDDNLSPPRSPRTQNIDEQVAGGVCIGVGGYGNVYAVEAPVCDAQGIATGATKPLALKIVTADEGLDTEKTHELVLDETTNYIKLQGNPAVVKVRTLCPAVCAIKPPTAAATTLYAPLFAFITIFCFLQLQILHVAASNFR